jgi:hypothetical protein
MAKYEGVREEEIEGVSKCPSLEFYNDVNVITMDGTAHKRLGAKISPDNC